MIAPKYQADFVCHMEDILHLYQQPYSKLIPVVCMDEQPVQLVKETRTPLPLQPGQPARFDFEYERMGATNIFLLLSKIEIHYTPKHGSWLNVAEIELSALKRQCLNRRIPDEGTLAREICSWSRERNHAQKSVDWRFTTNDARIKLKTLYPQIGVTEY